MKHLRRNFMCACAQFILIGLSNPAQCFLIDDFRPIDRSQDITLQGPLPERSFVGVQVGTMLTGERDIEILNTHRNEAPSLYYAGYGRIFNQDEFRVGGTGFGGPWQAETCTVTLQYDGVGDEASNLGFGERLTNSSAGTGLLPSGVGGLRIWSASPGLYAPVFATVYLRKEGALLSQLRRDIFNGGSTFIGWEFEFSEAVLTEADSITIAIEIPQFYNDNTDVYISHIDTIVPEPLGLIPIGAGFAWLLVRRRRVGGR